MSPRSSHRVRALILLTLASLLVLGGCAGPIFQGMVTPEPATAPGEAQAPGTETVTAAPAPETNLTEGCVENYDPNVDYFPEKVQVEYAGGFQVEYARNYKVVSVINPWQGADVTFRYLLVQCGTPAPEGVEADQVIQVPIRSIVTLSTTYLPHLVNLGVVDRLVALDSLLWTTTPEVRARIDAGEIAEVGSGPGINVELLLDLAPDLVMAYGIGIPDYDTHPVLEQAGIPVVLNGDFVEQHPLGRAEWGKFIALFFNKEGQAEASFRQVTEEYTRLQALAADITEMPTVFLGSVYNGTWWMAGGESYTARLLADAGADYLFKDLEGVASQPLDFETVLDRAQNADFWVNPDNAFWNSIADVLASDERYGQFAAVQNKQLYNNNKWVNENGGNAYYEHGAANPQEILADLIAIFHPDRLPDRELLYYKRLE